MSFGNEFLAAVTEPLFELESVNHGIITSELIVDKKIPITDSSAYLDTKVQEDLFPHIDDITKKRKPLPKSRKRGGRPKNDESNLDAKNLRKNIRKRELNNKVTKITG